MPKIAILVPTYLRPLGLKRTLDAIALLDLESAGDPHHVTSNDITVTVADNDPKHRAGATLVANEAISYRFSLECLVVEERGIPHVRNQLLEYAVDVVEAQYCVFVDDDEAPDPSWLRELLSNHYRCGSDIVGGAVEATFETEPPKWARTLELFVTPQCKDGLVELIDSTANVLISTAILSRISRPWFNPAYALTGGSDKEFFLRAKGNGATFSWAERAVVNELVPASRATRSWVLQRAYRIGNLDMRLALSHRSPGRVIRELIRGAAALLAGCTAYVANPFSEEKRLMALRRIYRQRGKLAALKGSLYEEYKTIHGA